MTLRPPRRVGWLLLAGISFLPAAQAHLVDTGFGTYYDGLVHLVATPPDLLLVVALGLLSGLAGAPAARAVLGILPLSWLAGALIGDRWPQGGELGGATPLVFGVVGLLVAINLRIPRAGVAGLALFGGLLHGYANGVSLRLDGQDGFSLAGVATGVFVLASLIPAAVIRLEAPPLRIAVRVLGSWIAAVGLLMVGWNLRSV